jgi:hypothetical protein
MTLKRTAFVGIKVVRAKDCVCCKLNGSTGPKQSRSLGRNRGIKMYGGVDVYMVRQ